MIKNLSNAISDKLQFYINNQLGGASVRVAIATGNIDVEGVELEYDKQSGDMTGIVRHHHNIEGLVRENHSVDTILDDGSVTVNVNGEEGEVLMGAVDSSKSIQHAKRSLAADFRWFKKITIAANDTTAYNTSMSVATLDPFKQTPENVIDLNQYYRVDQYQNDKIELEFNEGDLQWNNDFFWAINVPAGVSEQITVEFY